MGPLMSNPPASASEAPRQDAEEPVSEATRQEAPSDWGDDERPRRRRMEYCADGMCGAPDCPRCMGER
jgi:hypothetical protein